MRARSTPRFTPCVVPFVGFVRRHSAYGNVPVLSWFIHQLAGATSARRPACSAHRPQCHGRSLGVAPLPLCSSARCGGALPFAHELARTTSGQTLLRTTARVLPRRAGRRGRHTASPLPDRATRAMPQLAGAAIALRRLAAWTSDQRRPSPSRSVGLRERRSRVGRSASGRSQHGRCGRGWPGRCR